MSVTGAHWLCTLSTVATPSIAPVTLNYRDEDPDINLNVVHGSSRPMEIRYAISDNVGLGGHNGAVIFKRYDGD